MRILIAVLLLTFCIPAFAAGPNDGVYGMTAGNLSPVESGFASIHQNGDVVVFIVLNLESDGDSDWDAAQGLRTGDSAELLFLIDDGGVTVTLQFNDNLNATITITGCAASPIAPCDPVVGTVFDLAKVF
ncbi:MAG: hypothetical protein QGG67_21000 [Gammaproteobacteria bacterium]|jgi:hypothetical protein|nr:hypothetical protein [Gammaproteobacteria bacterium]MDP6098423.1 hypothetical protein [Gammaproteobacteria bacterium]|tara:strand:- start:384 stop:773 length:390 start_codon:yes stop_codon:yes gene_type:complete